RVVLARAAPGGGDDRRRPDRAAPGPHVDDLGRRVLAERCGPRPRRGTGRAPARTRVRHPRADRRRGRVLPPGRGASGRGQPRARRRPRPRRAARGGAGAVDSHARAGARPLRDRAHARRGGGPAVTAVDLGAGVPGERTTVPLVLSALAAALTAPRGFGDQSLLSPRPDAIRLLGGIPDPGALPVTELREVLGEVWDAGGGAASLQYSATPGLTGLRAWIAAREGVDERRVVITSGGLHGLSLTVQALVERGATVAVDNPAFPIFLRVLELVDARTLPVPVEADGIDVEHLARRLAAGERIAAVYTVPDFHNPSQGTLSAAKRAALVDLAERYGFVVIADDPYRELRFAGTDQGRQVFFDS